ncbi:hypothetical protein DPV78_006118 [Talaromyces pinophilus]|nr:hypothetical protein DPV78_006118 [Talaromyces pinophilus]
MSMVRLEDMVMLSRLLLQKDILRLFNYYSKREQTLMLRVEDTAVLSSVAATGEYLDIVKI